jgi:hypothetical protein
MPREEREQNSGIPCEGNYDYLVAFLRERFWVTNIAFMFSPKVVRLMEHLDYLSDT